MLGHVKQFIEEPPPDLAFEISEGGIAWARPSNPQPAMRPVESGTFVISPLHDNVLGPEAMTAAVAEIAATYGARKRRTATLILPDYCGRIAVLDFDAFPGAHEEQLSLVRFRMKKSVPFDVEAAAISFFPQPRPGNAKKCDVVVALVALEIVARYEAPFRMCGIDTGLITTSTLAAMDLLKGVTDGVMAKLSGRVLTLSVMSGGSLRMLRCVELPELTAEEVAGVLHPTFAYMEDEMKSQAKRLLLCGFGALAEEIEAISSQELGLTVEPVRSRFGAPGVGNAGLFGYLESVTHGARVGSAI